MDIITYVFYTHKKQRLAIMATEITKEEIPYMEITILKCSAKDEFKKSFAREALNKLKNSSTVRLYGELLHPEKLILPITSDFRKDFFNWANNTYFRKTEDSLRFNTIELQRGQDRIILTKTFPTKMSYFL